MDDFYIVVTELGEAITFNIDDETINSKMSVDVLRKGFNTDGEYLKFGVMTFDGKEQQDNLLGEYFTRKEVPNTVNILASISTESLTGNTVANIYFVECNEKINIISHFIEGKDEFGDPLTTPVYQNQNIDAYIKIVNREQQTTTVGNFVENTTTLVLPAKYTLSVGNMIEKNTFVFDNNLKKNVYKTIRYKVQGIDTSMMFQKQGTDEFKGVLTCLLTEDRG